MAIKGRVLLIQGDMVTANEIMAWLHDVVDVVHVTPDTDVLEAIKAEQWDMVITDSSTGPKNDVAITNDVKAVDEMIPVVIVTQHQKIDFILNALESHADALQFKPLDKTEFVQTVERLITECRNRRQNAKKVILAISAHPDDAEIGCGGILAQHQAKGDVVHMLTLSHGEKGGDPETRIMEAKKSAKMFSGFLYITKLKDAHISDGIETIKIIEELVNVIKPTHIYTHSKNDTHRDHRNVHFATLSACRAVSNIYCYQSPSSTIQFEPKMFVEISREFLNQKLEALDCFESQMKTRHYLSKDIIIATARYWGRFNNYTLSEPLEIVRERFHSK